MPTVDNLDIQIAAEATKAEKSLNDLINTLGKVSRSLGAINGTSINTYANSLSRLSNSIQGLNGINTRKISTLANNLTKLGNLNMGSLNNSTNSLRAFVNSMNSIPNLSANASSIGVLASNLSKLGGANTTKAIANIPLLANSLRDLMTTLSKAPTVSSNVIDMTNALSTLASQGSKVGKASKNLVGQFNKVSSSISKTTKPVKSLSSTLGNLYANFYWVSNGIKKLFSSIKASMDYIETLNYFEKAFEQVAEKADLSSFEKLGYESAEVYAKSFRERAAKLTAQMTGFTVGEGGNLVSTGETSLGLDPTQLMNYQAMFAQMSSSMNITSETSLRLSEAITKIGADLASVKNMDFEKVWTDMASGLAGMSRTLDKYGVNIRNVNLQQRLTELGINANITALNQNEKALLRSIILLDSTRYAWADLAETLDNPANQLRLLEANFNNLARTIGSIFMPAVQAVLPVVNALVIALQRLFSWIAGLLGIELTNFGDSIGGSSDIMSDLADEADATAAGIGGAAKAADKLKKSLRHYDELNVVPEKTETDSGGAGAGVGGLTDMSALNDALNAMLDEYFATWDKAYAEVENRAQEMADRITNAFGAAYEKVSLLKDVMGAGFTVGFGDTSVLDSIQGHITGIGESLRNIFTDPEVTGGFNRMLISWASSIGQIAGAFASVGATIADNLLGGIDIYLSENLEDIKTWLTDMFDIYSEAMRIIADFGVAFADVFTVFRSEPAKQITADIIEIFSSTFMNVTELASKLGRDILDMITMPFTENTEGIKEALMNTLEPLSTVTGSIAETITTTFERINEVYDQYVSPFLTSIGEGFSEIFKILLDGYNQYVAPVLDNLANNFAKVMETSIQPLIDNLLGLLGKLFELLQNVWETILQPIAELAASILMPILAAVVDVVGNALLVGIKLLADGLNAIITVLDKVIGFINDLFDFNFKDFLGDASKAFEDGAKAIDQAVQDIVKWVTEGFNGIAETAGEKVEALKKDISEKWENIKKDTTEKWNNIKQSLSTVWNNIKSTAANVWNNIKTTLSTVVNTIKNTITTAFNTVRSTVASVFNNVYSTISSKINAAKDAVSRAIEKIKDLFDFEFEWPDLKLPHFEIEGKFSLNPPSVPRLDIDWYAQGAVFDSPSVIGVGERGAEAVMPLEHNTGWIDNLADRIAVKIAQHNTSEPQSVNVDVTIEGEMRNLLRAIVKENSAYRKQTGMSMF